MISAQKRPTNTTRRDNPCPQPQPSKVRTALVIGGGIAGPVVATALLAPVFQATVYEAYPALAAGIGGGLALAPNGLAALGLVGADDAVRALATPVTRHGHGGDGGNTRRLPGPWRRRGAATRSSAAATCTGYSTTGRPVLGVRFEYGKRLVGATEGPDSVTAKFDDGCTATADVLIGADGVRSIVRTLIDPEAPPPATPDCSASRATSTPPPTSTPNLAS